MPTVDTNALPDSGNWIDDGLPRVIHDLSKLRWSTSQYNVGYACTQNTTDVRVSVIQKVTPVEGEEGIEIDGGCLFSESSMTND